MAPRKRKVQVVSSPNTVEKKKHCTALYSIVLNSQHGETVHTKCVKELKNLYSLTKHEIFMMSFIHAIKNAMEKDETNEYGNSMLKFCAKFVSSFDGDETHPIIASVFNWLLNTISSKTLIRFKICQFVNLMLNSLGPEAALDDYICDKILKYMLERMRDISQNVRVQAILALQRLQDPENPDDLVFKAYTFHLDVDPSPKVRKTIITSIGRNYNTMPHILERLWDVDENVRRHTYLQMSSYPVKSYKVAQRLTFLEQGLNDLSENVRKMVTNILLPQWIESYGRNYLSFVAGLKIDANESEIERFRATAKMALLELFKKSNVANIVSLLELNEEKTIALDDLSLERVILWQAVLEYVLQESADDSDLVVIELSTFSNYIQSYAEINSSIVDKWQIMYHQFTLLTLLEMVAKYDYGDEFGREKLQQVLFTILKDYDLDERNVKLITEIFEHLISDQEVRFKYLVNLIKGVIEPSRSELSNSRIIIDKYLEKYPDKSMQFKITSLRLNIMDLKEQEMEMVERKNYVGAKQATDELAIVNEEYANLLKPIIVACSGNEEFTSIRDSMLKTTRLSNQTINKCLQISFYMVNSKKVKSLTPVVCELYRDFIGRHVESQEIVTRDWALQCGAAYSMLYDGLSKEIFNILNQQFLRNHSTRIWKTSIECIFELLDRYGFEHFDLEDKQAKSRKSFRQLYNTTEYLEQEEEAAQTPTGTGIDLMRLMTHFLETCDDTLICSAIIDGFCRLILRGHYTSQDMVAKLLLKYFNPVTEPKINQILGIFFESLFKKKKQEHLQKALLHTLFIILEAPYESPLKEIRPEKVIKFVIDSTRPIYCSPGLNLHNTIAMSFLQVMLDNSNYKELLKMLSKALLTLDISDDPVLKNDLIACTEKLTSETVIDSKVISNITIFKQMLNGTYVEPLSFSSSKMTFITQQEHESDTEVHNLSDGEEDADKSGGDLHQNDNDTETVTQEILEQDRPIIQINKSILGFSGIPKPASSSLPCTPTTFGQTNSTGLKSLRKSMHIRRSAIADVHPFKVPRQINVKSSSKPMLETSNIWTSTQKSIELSQRGEETFNIPSTQDLTVAKRDDETLEHVEIPETQPMNQPSQAPVSSNGESGESSSSSKEDDEDVVLPSPKTITKTKRYRSALPGTRTRNSIREDYVKENIMTRKSLAAINSPASSSSEIITLASPLSAFSNFTTVTKSISKTKKVIVISQKNKDELEDADSLPLSGDKRNHQKDPTPSQTSLSSASSNVLASKTPRRKRLLLEVNTPPTPLSISRSTQNKSRNIIGSRTPSTRSSKKPNSAKNLFATNPPVTTTVKVTPNVSNSPLSTSRRNTESPTLTNITLRRTTMTRKSRSSKLETPPRIPETEKTESIRNTTRNRMSRSSQSSASSKKTVSTSQDSTTTTSSVTTSSPQKSLSDDQSDTSLNKTWKSRNTRTSSPSMLSYDDQSSSRSSSIISEEPGTQPTMRSTRLSINNVRSQVSTTSSSSTRKSLENQTPSRRSSRKPQNISRNEKSARKSSMGSDSPTCDSTNDVPLNTSEISSEMSRISMEALKSPTRATAQLDLFKRTRIQALLVPVSPIKTRRSLSNPNAYSPVTPKFKKSVRELRTTKK